MSLIQPTRRGLIGALIASPAVVRMASIMPVRSLLVEDQGPIESVLWEGREYILIKRKGGDGVIRSSLLMLV